MAYLLLALMPIGFGLNPVTARALNGIYEPATLTLIRWFFTALIVGALALSRYREERCSFGWSDAPRMLFLGVLGMAFSAYAAYAAAKTAPATNVGLVYACTSAVVAAVEICEGRTRLSAMLLAGLVACFTGVALVLTRGDLAALLSVAIGPGELWAVAGMVMWAGYTLGMRRRPGDMTPIAMLAVLSVVAALAAVPLTMREIAEHGLPPLGPVHLAWLTALVLLSGVGAFLAYNLSIRLSGPVLTAASISLVPVYIAIMAVVLLGETVVWYHFVAIGLVAGGLVLLTLARARVLAAQSGARASADVR